jgi:hypothetical protein
MRHRAAFAILWLAMPAAAHAGGPASSVNDVIALVRAGLARKDSDSQISNALRKVDLAEGMDPVVVEELESEGAGPKAVAELERLRDESRGLLKSVVAAPLEVPPPPSKEEQERVLAGARTIALSYTKSLPDFICEQEVRRYHGAKRGWDLKDTLTLRLSYFEQKEVYKLLTINGRKTALPYEALGGAVTQGEFGSLLRQIFEGGGFRWDHWTNLRRRRTHVYAFRVTSTNSRYILEYRSGGEAVNAVTGLHGFVYVDAETGSVMRIAGEVDTIPSDFPVVSSSTLLDYDFTTVGKQAFLLPLRAEVRMATASIRTRNEVEFHSYRKFAAETSITFGDPQ